jgi:hypothetical protein
VARHHHRQITLPPTLRRFCLHLARFHFFIPSSLLTPLQNTRSPPILYLPCPTPLHSILPTVRAVREPPLRLMYYVLRSSLHPPSSIRLSVPIRCAIGHNRTPLCQQKTRLPLQIIYITPVMTELFLKISQNRTKSAIFSFIIPGTNNY